MYLFPNLVDVHVCPYGIFALLIRRHNVTHVRNFDHSLCNETIIGHVYSYGVSQITNVAGGSDSFQRHRQLPNSLDQADRGEIGTWSEDVDGVHKAPHVVLLAVYIQ